MQRTNHPVAFLTGAASGVALAIQSSVATLRCGALLLLRHEATLSTIGPENTAHHRAINGIGDGFRRRNDLMHAIVDSNSLALRDIARAVSVTEILDG